MVLLHNRRFDKDAAILIAQTSPPLLKKSSGDKPDWGLEWFSAGVLLEGGTMDCMKWLSLGSLLLGLSLGEPASAATLVQDGKARAFVVLPPKPDDTEKLAARELIDHIEKMSGVRLETVNQEAQDLDRFLEQTRQDGKVAVCLGR